MFTSRDRLKCQELLRKYYAVLSGDDLLELTAVAQFDWEAPFRIPWIGPGYEEPPLEEAAPLTDDEHRAYVEARGGAPGFLKR